MLFVNGPVQNGGFTFDELPGKAVGIRIAAALNTVLGVPPLPHLWNTVTLAGDLRHRRYIAAGGQLSRGGFESTTIAATYGAATPVAGVVTDADRPVAELAIQIIERRLRSAQLRIIRQAVRVCSCCGHMTGVDGRPCRACGCLDSRAHTAELLSADRDPAIPALPVGRLHSIGWNPAKHLRDIAGDVPARLALSRTRDHGISLGPVGLPGLVLDPRAGLHVAGLAAARARQVETVVMTVTANAAANIAAYGQHFVEHDGLRLLYVLHGRVPYDHVTTLHAAYAARALDSPAQQAFETWFLPLLSLEKTNGVQAGQLPGLLRYFHRVRLAMPAEPDPDIVQALCGQIRAGDPSWVTHKSLLTAAMSINRDG